MRGLVLAVLAPLLAACGNTGEPSGSTRVIGLSTSLPLLWGESGDIRGHLAGQGGRHWAMTVLEQRGKVVPLDTLAGPHGLALPADGLLVLAQPRPLSPDENLALDAWVRSGGRLLLFADPMLTAESAFPLGDPRRPEAMAMLSPILRHWGLEPQFDEDQPLGARTLAPFGIDIPVELPGRFRPRQGAPCKIEAEGFAADCVIGKGRVIALADAAVFDGDDAGRRATFEALLRLLNS
jgi:hypothetical protein